MALGVDYVRQDCSLARALEVVGERWTLLILRDCFLGVRRFSDFEAHLDISKAVLTARLSALVELLYGSGLRATELVSMPRNAIAPDRPFVIIRGKGGKERLVPVSDRARGAFQAGARTAGSRPGAHTRNQRHRSGRLRADDFAITWVAEDFEAFVMASVDRLPN